MNFKEAMKLAIEGSEIRRQGWFNTFRYRFNLSTGRIENSDCSKTWHYLIRPATEGDDWEIYVPRMSFMEILPHLLEGKVVSIRESSTEILFFEGNLCWRDSKESIPQPFTSLNEIHLQLKEWRVL